MKATLTVKQEKYIQGLFTGMSQREAYKQSYSAQGMTDKQIDEEACKLAGNPKVTQRLLDLTNEVKDKNIWTIEEILKDIKSIANDPEAKRFEKLKALELGGKHLGMFTERVESVNTNTNYNISSDVDLFKQKATPEEYADCDKLTGEDIKAIMSR